MKKIQLFIIITIAMICNSCATIFNTSQQKVTFNSEPPGATVQNNGKFVCVTPCVENVKRAHFTTYTISKEGYQNQIIEEQGSFNYTVLANVLFGVIGLGVGGGVDYITGAAWKYKNDLITAKLTSVNSQTENISTQVKQVSIITQTNTSSSVIADSPKRDTPTQLNQPPVMTQRNTSTQHSETFSSPFRLKVENTQEALRKLEEEYKKLHELWQQEVEKKREALSQNQSVSEAVKIAVEPTVEIAKAEDGSQEVNMNISFGYETKISDKNVKVDASVKTDDFPAGAYSPSSSNACKLLLEFIKNKTETELAQYLTPGTKVTIKITGETDGAPIRNRLPYKGEFGDFSDKLIFLNGSLENITVTKQTGVNTNAQLAFLRTQGVQNFLENYIDPLQETQNTFQIFAIENQGHGVEHRKISIELIIHGALNKAVQQEVVSQSPAEEFVSDIDKNIPSAKAKNDDFFALIIANENYVGGAVPDVPFAKNDAKTIAAYCKTTLGIPDRQVLYIENGTGNNIQNGIDQLTALLKSADGNGRAVVFYAGHGIPNPATNEAYIIPVDANPTRFNQLVSLKTLYSTLGEIPSESVLVVLDACFSGTRRNGEMILEGTRSVRIKPKEEALKGNVVVISATDGYQVAQPIREQKHGLFTYYFLKILQESNGDITLGQWFEKSKRTVSRESILISTEQTPTVTVSPALEGKWNDIKF